MLVTEPVPAPLFETVSTNWGRGAKSAPTVTAELPITKLQTPVPEQAPVQPANCEVVVSGAAVSVTVAPELIVLEFVHVPDGVPDVIVQLMPPVPVTVPLPVPAPVTVTVVRLKVAVTASATVISTLHAPVPVQAPPQPANAEPAGAVAFKVTVVPLK